MTRRGFFGALLGGLAAATGLRALVKVPVFGPGRRIVMLKGAAMGKTETAVQLVGEAVALPGMAPWRTAPAPWLSSLSIGDDRSAADGPAPSGSTGCTDGLPEVWPGPSGLIAATANLPPLEQLETLIELFGTSGEAAPSFAAALVGELVLTRMRLADLRRLHAPMGSSS